MEKINQKKKKHSKFPKKAPSYNIKLELKDLYKQNIREKHIKKKFKSYNRRSSKILINKNILYNEKKESETFMEKIDRYSQPNKLKKDIIHGKLSKGSPK